MTPGRSEILASAKTPAPSAGGSSIHTGFCRGCLTVHPINKIGDKCACGSEVIDREWPTMAMTDLLIREFEKEVRRRHRKVYIDQERDDPEEASKMREKYSVDMVAGRYNYDDDVNANNFVRTARMEYWGVAHGLYLILNGCDRSVTAETAEHVFLANTRDAMAEYFWSMGIVGNSQSPQRGAEWLRALKESKSRKNPSPATPSATASAGSHDVLGSNKPPAEAATFS